MFTNKFINGLIELTSRFTIIGAIVPVVYSEKYFGNNMISMFLITIIFLLWALQGYYGGRFEYIHEKEQYTNGKDNSNR